MLRIIYFREASLCFGHTKTTCSTSCHSSVQKIIPSVSIKSIKETNMIKTEYKKGGRPTKGIAEKKKYRITVKLNTQDYYTLKGKAKSAGVTMSEFVRKVLDKGNVIERLTVEQADFIRKLCGMANNLNQLAHRANAEGFHTVAPFHKIIISKIDEILNLIRR